MPPLPRDPSLLDLYGPDAEAERERAREFLTASSHTGLQLEIGFGRGVFLSELAAAQPQVGFLGFEVRSRNCLELLKRIDRLGLTNVRMVLADVRSVSPWLFPDAVVDAVYMLFPDPWWKKRHHKRRLLTPETLASLRRIMRPGALFSLKTDVPQTAELADQSFAATPGFEQAYPRALDHLPRSHRERRCLKVGLPVLSRCFKAVPTSEGGGGVHSGGPAQREQTAFAGREERRC